MLSTKQVETGYVIRKDNSYTTPLATGLPYQRHHQVTLQQLCPPLKHLLQPQPQPQARRQNQHRAQH